ncbi:MAG TPA: 7-carboxy-7-deazaguanine synthase QueE [candidate division Zixibacteria bacterium]|nr:7-carboxy-7-deazaguanine synthase QueE [candidate division Zixibacteria bacterium]
MTDLNETEPKSKGHLVELFSSFQGEGGSVRGSCFGRRQIFIRFAGCDLNCAWCDTAKSRDPNFPDCNVETVPGTWNFTSYKNPVDEEFVIEQVLNLSTRDFHSVSLTGGEPAFQEEFFYIIVDRLYSLELPVYLETNGYFPKRIAKVAPMISYACVDIKDRSAKSVKNNDWDILVEKELESISVLNEHAAKVFAKMVVTENTTIEDVRMIADRIREIVIPIVIQPVTPIGDVKPISNQKLFQITETIAEVLPTDLFGISIQGHKMINFL